MINTTITNEGTHTIRNTYLGFQVGMDSGTSNRTLTTAEYKQTYFVYMGVAGIPSEKARINFAHDTTDITGTAWADIGVFRGIFALGGTASLTNIGSTDGQQYFYNPSTTNSGSTKTVELVLNPPVRAGDHLWIGYGVSASTMPILHASPHSNPAFPGTIQQVVPTVRPTSLTGPFATTGLTNTAFRPIAFKLTIY